MVAGAPAGEIRAIDEKNKRQRVMEQNEEITGYTYTCVKCSSDTFSRRYRPASEELNEHLKCQCTICGYIWRMDSRDKED